MVVLRNVMTLYNIIFGAEIWLAVAIWSFGAMCGIGVMLLGMWIGRNKHD